MKSYFFIICVIVCAIGISLGYIIMGLILGIIGFLIILSENKNVNQLVTEATVENKKDSKVSDMERWYKLYKEGAITEQEFLEKKKELMK